MSAVTALLGAIAGLITALGTAAYLVIGSLRKPRGDSIGAAEGAQVEIVKQLLSSPQSTDQLIQAIIEAREGGRPGATHRPEAD